MFSQSARIGTAKKRSPKLALVSPSYNATPDAKRLPLAAFSFRKPRKSAAVTVAEALTSTPATALDHDVHLGTVLIAEMEKVHRFIAGARLPPLLLKGERLQHLVEKLAVSNERIGAAILRAAHHMEALRLHR